MTSCEKIRQEYEELKTLKREFDLEFERALETGNLTRAKELKAILEQKRDALKEKINPWANDPYFYPKELKRVVRKEKYKQFETLEGHTDYVWTLQILPDGRIVSGSGDKTIKIWEKDKEGRYASIETLEEHTDYVRTLQILPDGRIVSGSGDSTIKIWEKDKEGKYTVLQTLRGHENWVETLQVLPDGRIVSGSGDKTIKIWDGLRK